MSATVVLCVAIAVVLCFIVEFATVVLPLVLVLAFVAPEDRPMLANVLAAADKSRRMRLWPALRRAVLNRRRT